MDKGISELVHGRSKREIKAFALSERRRGAYYDVSDVTLDEVFKGSIDRFCDIAYAFRSSRRVLDAGSGHGLLLALLKLLGHEVHGIDFGDHGGDPLYRRHAMLFAASNLEADPLPFDSEYFDAVCSCQVFEHFTYSHLPPLLELKRVLAKGGTIEIDVPNVVCFRNRSRLLRGKNITYDYREHYLHAEPVEYRGRQYFPARHNREFTRAELRLLLKEAGFRNIRVDYLKSRRYRTGMERIKDLGTALKDAVPSFRKSLIAFAEK